MKTETKFDRLVLWLGVPFCLVTKHLTVMCVCGCEVLRCLRCPKEWKPHPKAIMGQCLECGRWFDDGEEVHIQPAGYVNRLPVYSVMCGPEKETACLR